MRVRAFYSVYILALLSPAVISCGAEANEPAIFSGDFESQSSDCWSSRGADGWNLAGCGGFINIGKGPAVSLAQGEIAHSGSRSLKLTYSQNEETGGADVQFSERNHVFTRFFDYYSNGFDFAYGMKMHRIRSFNSAGGINNFDIVMVPWGRPTSGFYNFTGTNDMQSISLNYNGGPVDWTPADANYAFQRARWYCVETEVKLNDPGTSNGHVRLWVDGNLVVQRSNLNIRGNMTAGLNSVMFGGWYSNGAAGQNPQPNPSPVSVRYVDDVAIGSEKIGCDTGGDREPEQPPNAPGGLSVTGRP